MSGKTPLVFKIYKGDELLRTETLAQPVIKIGKLSSSHLRIDDEQVSRMHAVIEVTSQGEISIIDLGSAKGTLVNGQKVNKAKLQDGDVILLGETKIVLAVGQAEAATSAPAASVSAPADATTPSAPPPGMGRSTGASPAMSSTPPPRPGLSTGSQPAFGRSTGPSPSLSSPPATFSSPAAPPPPGIAPPPGLRAPAPFGAAAPSLPPPQFGSDAGADLSGERAVEVAAMLTDSVVAVKHLTNPKSGKVTPLTYGLFGGGAALLLMSLIAFNHGINVAEENLHNYERWVEVEKQSPLDFRAKRLNPGWDLMAILGLGGGLFAVIYGYARFVEEKKSPYFRIGRDRSVEFPTDTAPSDAFALVGPAGGGNEFVFSWAPGMKGEMTHEGKQTPIEQLPQTAPIPHGARIRVEVGQNTFLVSSVPMPRRQKTGFLASLDGTILAFFGGSALVHLAFLALLFSIPPDPKSLALDVLGNNDRLNKATVKPPEDPKQMEDETQKGKEETSGGTGTKQAGDEGKMGKKDSTRASGQFAMKNNNAPPQLAKAQVQEMARTSGILGALRAQQGGAFAALTGTGDFSSGLDDRDVYGGLMGNEVGEMAGGWGYGVSGTGAGGGGTGLGTVGLGRYGTIGHGSGTGSGYGIGSGKGGMRGRTASQPRVNIGNATSTGDLDKNIIRRYIRQKLPQIQHCYEKQLVVKQSLAGTVTVQFVINGNGSVISARAGGMGDNAVESCVAAAIQSIQFPKPTGGGIVNVTYPFTFRAAGE